MAKSPFANVIGSHCPTANMKAKSLTMTAEKVSTVYMLNDE